MQQGNMEESSGARGASRNNGLTGKETALAVSSPIIGRPIFKKKASVPFSPLTPNKMVFSYLVEKSS